MRNTTAIDASIKLVDGVYADFVLRHREEKDPVKKKQMKLQIEKILKIRYVLIDFHAGMNGICE
jgi:hypothetical protein